MKKVYLDCNILIDWLLDREPYSYYASKVIELTEENKIISFVSGLTLANTYYIIKKELNKEIANEFLKDSLNLFKFLSITEFTIKKAISKQYKDFEDDLHYTASIENDIDYLITRNKKDFPKNKIKIVDAKEFLEINFNLLTKRDKK